MKEYSFYSPHVEDEAAAVVKVIEVSSYQCILHILPFPLPSPLPSTIGLTYHNTLIRLQVKRLGSLFGHLAKCSLHTSGSIVPLSPINAFSVGSLTPLTSVLKIMETITLDNTSIHLPMLKFKHQSPNQPLSVHHRSI
jgi:hypothetical protein